MIKNIEGNIKGSRELKTPIYRENYKLESSELVIEFPFHGSPTDSDFKFKTLVHNHHSHPDATVFRRKTIHCRLPACPDCNILWLDYGKQIPYLETNGNLVPAGWWKYSAEVIQKRFDVFQENVESALKVINKNTSGGLNSNNLNIKIDGLISEQFTKNIPAKSKVKLHNILWYMMKSNQSFRVYHLVLSPPQDTNYLTQKGYEKLKNTANRMFFKAGGWGGVVFMHHARVVDKFNRPDSSDYKGIERSCDTEGVHFHAIGVGFFEFEDWKDTGWVIKNIRYDEEEHRVTKTNSVKKTSEYILEHVAVVSKKIKIEDGDPSCSLSCPTAFLPLSNQSNDRNNYKISGDIESKNTTAQKPNDLRDLEKTIDFPVSESVKKSHMRKIRNYSTYWFIGCLKKVKVPIERTTCPLTEHEIEKNSEFHCAISNVQTVSVNIDKRLQFLIDFKKLEFDKESGHEIDNEIKKLKQMKKKEKILTAKEVVEILPLEYGKFFNRVETKCEKVLQNYKGGLRNHVEEACFRFHLSDPHYAWFQIKKDEIFTKYEDADIEKKFYVKILWKESKFK